MLNYYQLMYVHLFTVIPCFIIGGIMMFLEKGTTIHKAMGRVYMVLMLFTASVTLFMPSHVGPVFLNHFGLIHSFSFLTIYTVPTAYFAIKRNDVKTHQRKMILLYVFAILIAGGFTLTPGRYLHHFFFG